MSTEKAATDDLAGPAGDDDELDHAIDELRGVLRQGAGEADGAAGHASAGGAMDAIADFGEEPAAGFAADAGPRQSRFDLVMDIPIDVEIVLGAARMPVSALMKLSQGSTIALDRKIGEPVEIVVNGRVIGRGEITVLEEDETRFGVRLLEVDTDTGKG